MTRITDDTTRTAQGIFLGAAVGDALGWPQEARGGLVGGQKERDRAVPRAEFRGWNRYGGHHASRYQDPVHSGEYSDDTQLLLATARSCLAGDRWWERLTNVELPAWPTYQRGGGGAVLAAAASWAASRPPWKNDGTARSQALEKRYRNAGANGVAMRIAPHVLWAKDIDDLIRRIVRDGITTHGHPRALVGALVHAFVLFHAASSQSTHGFGDSIEAAAHGLIDADQILPILPSDWGTPQDRENFTETWRETNAEVSQLLTLITDSLERGALSDPDSTLERLGCANPKINGAGTVSAVAAIYLASRFAARPQDGLISAAFLRKADTDTLASLTGSILGALHGTKWLGKLADDVQDSDYIVMLAGRSATNAIDPPPWPTRSPRELRRMLVDALHRREMTGEFPDGRQYHFDEATSLHEDRVLRARLQLDDGQTAVVDLRLDPPVASGQGSHEPLGQTSHGSGSLPEHQYKNSGQNSAGDNNRTLTRSPMVTAQPPVASATVILSTRNLAQSAAFYAKLTGRNIPVRAGTAEIASGFLLQTFTAETFFDVSSSIVHITVDSLLAATRRLGLDADLNAPIEVRDPDGRIVRISQNPAASQPSFEKRQPPVSAVELPEHARAADNRAGDTLAEHRREGNQTEISTSVTSHTPGKNAVTMMVNMQIHARELAASLDKALIHAFALDRTLWDIRNRIYHHPTGDEIHEILDRARDRVREIDQYLEFAREIDRTVDSIKDALDHIKSRANTLMHELDRIRETENSLTEMHGGAGVSLRILALVNARSGALASDLFDARAGALAHARTLAARHVDASGSDLSSLAIKDTESLDGIVWSEKTTIWPDHIASQIRQSSVEIKPGIYRVRLGHRQDDEILALMLSSQTIASNRPGRHPRSYRCLVSPRARRTAQRKRRRKKWRGFEFGVAAVVCGLALIWSLFEPAAPRRTGKRPLYDAIEPLGSDKPGVRIGGILALERIALDYPIVMEILSAFLREQSVPPPPDGSLVLLPSRLPVSAGNEPPVARETERPICARTSGLPSP